MFGAMILAAGRGERMRPLSDQTPKPLLRVGGKPLIVWQIEALARAGFCDLVINASHHANQLIDFLNDALLSLDYLSNLLSYRADLLLVLVETIWDAFVFSASLYLLCSSSAV